jgi:integrase
MDFTGTLVEKLKERGLTDSSVSLYVRNLEKLNANKPLNNLNFLKKYADIMGKLEGYKGNTQRGFLISIVSSLSSFKGDKGVDTLLKRYYKTMIDLNKSLNLANHNGVKTETQNANWIDWSDVEHIYDGLRDNTTQMSSPITEGEYNKLLDLVVLSLYVLNPPRRNSDYMNMKVVSAFTPEVSEALSGNNILDWNGKRFIFRNYKTSKKYGETVIPIPKELHDILATYFEKKGILRRLQAPVKKTKKEASIFIEPFLTLWNDKPFMINSITRILNRVFGKKIGSSMLRHIYTTKKFGKQLAEQKETAEQMGHSVAEMNQTYIKED